MNGQLLGKIYRREGKRKSVKEIFLKEEIILTDTLQGKLLVYTSTPSLLGSTRRSLQDSAGQAMSLQQQV